MTLLCHFVFVSMPMLCTLCLQYVKTNKEADNDWFRLESNKEGTKCVGGGGGVRMCVGVSVQLQVETSVYTCE